MGVLPLRKRNHRVEIYFTDDELARLTERVRKSGLPREKYCREVLNGAEVREAPPADVPALIREVRRVGSNLDQILLRAHAIGLLDVPELRRTVDEINTVNRLISNTYKTGAH